jgi:ADP-heptose:LPS heptosyltransferase
MHRLSLNHSVNLGKILGVVPVGHWVVHDINAFEIAQIAPRGAALVDHFVSESGPTELPGLIMRSGAIGDILLLTPVLREWKRQFGHKVNLCCFPHHFPLFRDTSIVDNLIPYPLKYEDALKFRIVSLENTMECDHSQHATGVFAKALGLQTPLPDYKPVYHVTDEEKTATKKYIFANRPNLAVQPRASVKNRDYPLPLWLEVISKLEKLGWGILLLGSKGQIPPIPPNIASPFIRNLAEEELKFRESAAVLSQCDAFVGVDSAFLHLCHALDIPAVGLFAAFDWKTRTSKAPKTFALTGVGECAPCSWHMHAGRHFPPNKPCTTVGRCVVLESIPPDKIVKHVSLLKP